MSRAFKTSEHWANLLLTPGQIILDPDGWDRQNFQFSFFEERINEEEFNRRMMFSTVMLVPLEKK